MEIPGEQPADLLELHPLFPEEIKLVQKRGFEALIRLFEKHDIECSADPKRVNVGSQKR